MFKTLTVYQLTQATASVVSRLSGALESKPFAPVKENEHASVGFVPPLGIGTEAMTYEANGGALFCLRIDEKEVPAAVVRDRLEAMKRDRATDGAEPMTRAEERAEKERIKEGFYSMVLAKPTYVAAYIDKQLHMLFVAASDDLADTFIHHLGQAFGGRIPVKLLGIEDEPCDKFTAWVRDTDLLGDSFELGHQGALKFPDRDGGCGNINAKNEDFDSPDFLHLLESGRQVCSISLEHEELKFRLTSKLGIRNIALSDDAKAETFDPDAGAVTVHYEFAVFVKTMRQIMRDLEPILGPWPHQEVLDLGGEHEAAA